MTDRLLQTPFTPADVARAIETLEVRAMGIEEALKDVARIGAQLDPAGFGQAVKAAQEARDHHLADGASARGEPSLDARVQQVRVRLLEGSRLRIL